MVFIWQIVKCGRMKPLPSEKRPRCWGRKHSQDRISSVARSKSRQSAEVHCCHTWVPLCQFYMHSTVMYSSAWGLHSDCLLRLKCLFTFHALWYMDSKQTERPAFPCTPLEAPPHLWGVTRFLSVSQTWPEINICFWCFAFNANIYLNAQNWTDLLDTNQPTSTGNRGGFNSEQCDYSTLLSPREQKCLS